MQDDRWIVTIDARYPPGVFEVPEGRLNFLLSLLAELDPALTMALRDWEGIAVTLVVPAASPTEAVARCEQLVLKSLESLALGDDWCVTALEACSPDGSTVVNALSERVHPLARTA